MPPIFMTYRKRRKKVCPTTVTIRQKTFFVVVIMFSITVVYQATTIQPLNRTLWHMDASYNSLIKQLRRHLARHSGKVIAMPGEIYSLNLKLLIFINNSNISTAL